MQRKEPKLAKFLKVSGTSKIRESLATKRAHLLRRTGALRWPRRRDERRASRRPHAEIAVLRPLRASSVIRRRTPSKKGRRRTGESPKRRRSVAPLSGRVGARSARYACIVDSRRPSAGRSPQRRGLRKRRTRVEWTVFQPAERQRSIGGGCISRRPLSRRGRVSCKVWRVIRLSPAILRRFRTRGETHSPAPTSLRCMAKWN